MVWQKNTSMSIIVGLFAREYVAWAKSLGSTVKHHEIEVTDEEICCRILTGLPRALHFVCGGLVVLGIGFSMSKLEQALVNVEKLQK